MFRQERTIVSTTYNSDPLLFLFFLFLHGIVSILDSLWSVYGCGCLILRAGLVRGRRIVHGRILGHILRDVHLGL